MLRRSHTHQLREWLAASCYGSKSRERVCVCVIVSKQGSATIAVTYCEDIAREVKEEKEGISKEHPVVDLWVLWSSRGKTLRRRERGGRRNGGLQQLSSFSFLADGHTILFSLK